MESDTELRWLILGHDREMERLCGLEARHARGVESGAVILQSQIQGHIPKIVRFQVHN